MTETEDGDAIAEELQVLEAVFCQDGEFTLHVHDRNEGSNLFYALFFLPTIKPISESSRHQPDRSCQKCRANLKILYVFNH